MQCRFDPAIRTTHLGHGIFECVLLTGPDPRRALWPAVMSTAQTGRTHGCSDQCCKVKILLANPEPSTHGPTQTLRCVPVMSAFGGRTDMGQGSVRLPLLTQNGLLAVERNPGFAYD